MTLDDILSDDALRQREFPVTRDRIYLAHAGVCPLPRRVTDAISAYTAAAAVDDQENAVSPTFISETRAAAARLLHARPDEIAFIGPTSAALSAVAAGLNLPRRGNVLLYFDDYPSNVYPWMALSERGLEVRLLNVRELGRIRPADVLGQVDEDTCLVALASCHFLSGYRLEIDAIGRGLRERNILFCLDAIQTLGAFPTTVEYVDFLAADAHKWLLGPTAAGLLYVRRELQDDLLPISLGWHNVLCPGFVAQEEMVLRDDARRYEAGSHNLLGLIGLRAALELVQELGIDAIAARLVRQRQSLSAALRDRGFRVLNPEPALANTSGILSFDKEGVSSADLVQRLAASGVTASLRTDRSGRQYVRLSPHAYITDADLERALALI